MELPKLMLGTSPFIGAGQFGSKALEYHKKFYENPKNMEKLFVKSAELGVSATQLMVYEPLIKALKNAEKRTGKFFIVAAIAEENFSRYFELIIPLEPELVAIHAMFCDSLDERLNEWIDKIREIGAIPAASTHKPGETIPRLESLDIGAKATMQIEAYLTPLNPIGFGMAPNFESALKAIKKTKKQVIAIKPLAAGKLFPEESLFEFIYKYADSIAVGITSKEEMEETYSVIRLHPFIQD
ncbi:MAG TPA: hypothetical protein EYP22_10380 [Methanosarcinales archaeon]|nr:hypothetical protein [Methanosarcinales archaeon]